jgi:N-acetylmuramic acid 6-phosphate etherase
MQLSAMRMDAIIALMTHEEQRALDAVRAVIPQLAAAAESVARVYKSGGRTIFLGSGTSGRLAAMEIAELPPTFGVSGDRFVAFVAGGPSAGSAAISQSEDDLNAAPAALAGARIGRGDAVIGLAASGTTPFVVAGLRAARQVGAWTCGIANNPATPVLASADIGIFLDTGPEVLTGSTRLKAGTAQKLALNRITTAALVRSGTVQSNLMVNAAGTNAKLRRRCIRIVRDLTAASETDATAALEASSWRTRAAIEKIGNQVMQEARLSQLSQTPDPTGDLIETVTALPDSRPATGI